MKLFKKIFFPLLVLVGMTCLQTHTMHAMKIETNNEQATLQNTIINPYTITGTTAGALFAVAAIFLLCETGWANKILASDMCKNIDENSSWFKYLIAQWAAIETKCSFANSTTKWRNACIKIVIILAAALLGGAAGYVIKDIKDRIEKARIGCTNPKHIHRKDIFKNVIGMTPAEFQQKLLNDKDGSFLKAILDKIKNLSGDFKTYTIKELQTEFEKNYQKAQGKPSITILQQGVNNVTEKEVEIGHLQATNPNATFLVASRQGCLEGRLVHYDRSKKEDTVQTDPWLETIQDGVQGEKSAYGCLAAAFKRQYEISDDDANLLFLLQQYGVTVTKEGKVDMAEDKIKEMQTNDWIEKIRIGVHKNAVVTSGHSIEEDCGCTEKVDFMTTGQEIKINQIFSAAQNCKHYSHSDNFALTLLKAAYQGALLEAAILQKQENKKGKIFLTLMGGGVFNNKPTLIIDAIKSTKEIIKKTNLDITFVIYDKPSSNTVTDQIVKNLKEFKNEIEKIA